MQPIQPSPKHAAPSVVPVAISTRVSTLHQVGGRFDSCESQAATLHDVTDTGLRWARAVHAVGWVVDSQIHALGDDAPWIAEQARLQFRQQGRYTVDLFHLCDYLAAAPDHTGQSEEIGGGLWTHNRIEAVPAGRVVTGEAAPFRGIAIRVAPVSSQQKKLPLEKLRLQSEIAVIQGVLGIGDAVRPGSVEDHLLTRTPASNLYTILADRPACGYFFCPTIEA